MHKSWILISVVTWTLLISGACSDAAAPRDIDEILIGKPTATNVQVHSVTIQATSTIDVACAVAYGLTSDYGQITTDDDMASGGHSDHHPVLRGLTADTVYHYQIGGMGPDGTMYQSSDLTFKTLPENTTIRKEIGKNLALLGEGARIVGTSSNYGGGNTGAVKIEVYDSPSQGPSNRDDGDM